MVYMPCPECQDTGLADGEPCECGGVTNGRLERTDNDGFARAFQYRVQQAHEETASGEGLDAIAAKYGMKRGEGMRDHGLTVLPETDVELRGRIKYAKKKIDEINEIGEEMMPR